MKWIAAAVVVLLAACQPGDSAGSAAPGAAPGDMADTAPFAEIADDAVLHFAGTEPFWGGQVTGTQLLWSTPENMPGETITVTRFAGRGGLTFSGAVAGQALDLAVTPGACSDGMSDRTYPFTVTVKLGSTQMNGCAWRAGDDLGVDAP